ncbi:MAG: hypothetical protein JJ879_01115 [Sneathiella sp.]|nr:hypothetical protein [Sneathiella sp.]
MDIVSDRTVRDETGLRTYREIDKRSLLVGSLLTPIILAILILPWVLFSDMPPWWLIAFCLVWGSILSFFPLNALKRYLISRQETSWRIGWSENGIWCRFRPPHLGGSNAPANSFAFIPAQNIDWLRVLDKTHEMTLNLNLQNNGKSPKYLEIGLKKLDLSSLREALKAERIRIRTHATFNAPLLTLSDEGTLLVSIEQPEEIISLLQPQFQVLEAKITQGKKFRDMSGPEMHQYIKSLVESGDKVTAIRATSDGFKCTLTEANRFVDALIVGQESPPLPRGARNN